MSRLITALESVQPEQPTSVDAFLPTCHRLIRLLGHLLSLGSTSLGLADDGGVRFIAAWLAAAQKADVGDVALAAALARVVVIVGRFDGLWTGNEHELGLAAKALADLALVRQWCWNRELTMCRLRRCPICRDSRMRSSSPMRSWLCWNVR